MLDRLVVARLMLHRGQQLAVARLMLHRGQQLAVVYRCRTGGVERLAWYHGQGWTADGCLTNSAAEKVYIAMDPRVATGSSPV